MDRRHFLLLSSGSLGLAGCLQAPSPPSGGNSDRVTLKIVNQAAQPNIPITYTVTLVQSVATKTQPGRLQITITNERDDAIALGEERDIKFHHVASSDRKVYLYPAGDGQWAGPVEPGCWRLTEHVAVPEYYGIETIPAGETLRAECFVYGHPDLAPDACLPAGDHAVRMMGIAADDEDGIVGDGEQTEFDWGFTLGISK